MSNSQRRPTVLVLTSTFPRWAGDTEPPFVFELCKRLTSHFEIHVLAPHAPGAARTESLEGIRVHRYRYWFERYQSLAYQGGILNRLKERPARIVLVLPFIIAQILAIRQILTRHRVDAIHAHWIIPQGLCAVLARRNWKPPLLCTSHGGDLYGLRHAGLPYLKRWVLGRCSGITVVSDAMANDVRALASDAPPAEVIPMGTDLRNAFFPDPTIERQEHALLFVGRLVEKKGVDVLLRAVAILRERNPAIRLLIVGSGPAESQLRSLAQELHVADAVTFLGAVTHQQLPTLYRMAALTVVPSVVAASGDQEGFGLVIVEAIGCGCPVVASDLPAIRQTIENGRTGLLSRPGDPTQLADRIATVLNGGQLGHNLAREGRAFVLERFDWSTITERYRSILVSTATGSASVTQSRSPPSNTSSNRVR